MRCVFRPTMHAKHIWPADSQEGSGQGWARTARHLPTTWNGEGREQPRMPWDNQGREGRGQPRMPWDSPGWPGRDVPQHVPGRHGISRDSLWRDVLLCPSQGWPGTSPRPPVYDPLYGAHPSNFTTHPCTQVALGVVHAKGARAAHFTTGGPSRPWTSHGRTSQHGDAGHLLL